MIPYSELHLFAARAILQRAPAEVEIRRSLSGLYYSLFHRFTTSGASIFAAGGAALQGQATRAYSHANMRKVCESYIRSPKRPFQPPLDALAPMPPDQRLIAVADAFVKLQEARHSADYDLAAAFTKQEGVELLQLASLAHQNFSDIQHPPETQVFLAALLLADRWTRRG